MEVRFLFLIQLDSFNFLVWIGVGILSILWIGLLIFCVICPIKPKDQQYDNTLNQQENIQTPNDEVHTNIEIEEKEKLFETLKQEISMEDQSTDEFMIKS
jgi:hypothetical protein